MDYTTNIYINCLNELILQYNFKINVHPVVPVLNETRHLVLKFNNILKAKIINKNERMIWLDIDKELLTEDETKLKSIYEMDGTHLNPTYISLIEKKMN